MTHTIRFATFNIGIGWQDYNSMVANFPDQKNLLKQKFDTQFSQHLGDRKKEDVTFQEFQDIQISVHNDLIKTIEESTAKRLAKECDVIALQEVCNLDRPFIQMLQSEGFEIHNSTFRNANNMFSTAIAIRKELFYNVENISIKSSANNNQGILGQEIAAVAVKIKNTKLQIAFSSLHSWGFQLYAPHIKRGERMYNHQDNINILNALKYIKEAKGVLKMPRIFGSFIAGDMNNNPENQPKPFDRMRKKYDLLTPDQPTNINGVDTTSDYPLRKIDFIFAPKSSSSLIYKIWAYVTTVFICRKPFITVSSAKVLPGFDFACETNCSDHKPVITTIHIITESRITALIKWLFNLS